MSKGSLLARGMRALILTLFLLLLGSILAVAALRWFNPPTSAVMVQHWVSEHLAGKEPPVLYHEWVGRDAIAPSLKLAVIAGEDQRFPEHLGFDLIELQAAWEDFRQGERLRGASTISQQTAKNLFLWNGRDYARKALEVWFTLLLETLLTKERIIELYLNIAQFSADTYGVGAASWRYFDRPAVAISAEQAARMAAVLPNPRIYRLDQPSAKVRQRARWIRQQMHQLGGERYLRQLGH
jgi:monofunctional biosynthetic peptidoglycan transglycosylase